MSLMKKQLSKKHHLFGLIGPTGAGKTEISKHMREKHGFFYIPSVTTRSVRKGNTEEYKHVEVDVFESFIKDKKLLEYAIFTEHYYGKLKKDIEKHLKRGHCIYTLTTDKVKKLKDAYTHTKIICILPQKPILETVEKRLKDRGHSKKEIEKRLETVKKDLLLIKKLKKKKLIDHFVQTLEEDYQHALKQIDKIVKKHVNPVR